MLRTTANLSAMAAWCGSSSQSSMPGTLVLIGWNSPRHSRGASGFMSYMSSWLGPPPREIMITLFEPTRSATWPAASSRNKSASANDPAESATDAKKIPPRKPVAIRTRVAF